MMQKPLVSVVISSFNRLEDLKECIKRSSDITYPNLEIIIVDASSRDGSQEFLKLLDKDKYKIIFIEDKGTGYSRLTGLKVAKGDFVISIDEDGFLRPDIIEKTVDIFLSNPSLGAVGYGFVNPYIDFTEAKYRKKTNYIDNPKRNLLDYNSVIGLCGCALRKKALEGFGYDDLNWLDFSKFKKSVTGKRMMTTEIETDLCFHLFVNGYHAVSIPELIVFHKSSPTNRNRNQQIARYIKRHVSILTKYYPYKSALLVLMRLIYYCLYHAILQKDIIYVKALIYSLQYAPKRNIFRNKRLSRSVYKLMKQHPMEMIFARTPESVYAGIELRENY